MNSFEKIVYYLKRHPLLYFVRYILLSKNSKEKNIDAIGCFNDYNAIKDVPKIYFTVNDEINADQSLDEFERALVIAKFLRKRIGGGAGIGLSSEKTLEKMLNEGEGVCSDFAQIFNTFCLINNIRVKEWGCVECFYKSKFGHSFNEIYSSKLQQWIAIDIHKGILFRDVKNNGYFSVVGLFQDLRKGHTLEVEHYSEYTSPDPERIRMVYSGKTLPFLINNTENSAIDYYYNKFHNALPSVMINTLLIVLRKNHTFIFVMDNYKVELLPKTFRNLIPS